ncbi:hypothetical protein RA993_23325, partial [Mycobacteroides abscessus subsp. abscessus]|uniref:hypothetical protein n=1 Tax=Mycobacteroides abscessus TaxID=36809 RepID=UPI003CF768C4
GPGQHAHHLCHLIGPAATRHPGAGQVAETFQAAISTDTEFLAEITTCATGFGGRAAQLGARRRGARLSDPGT